MVTGQYCFLWLLRAQEFPFPGETMLLVAAIYAGTTHHLSLPLVILAAAAGAILGDNLGFWVGREGGYHLYNLGRQFSAFFS